MENQTPSLRRSTRQFKLLVKLNDYVLSSNVKYGIKKFVNYSKLKGDNLCFATTLNKYVEQPCLSDVFSDPNWVEDMNNEIEALIHSSSDTNLKHSQDRIAAEGNGYSQKRTKTKAIGTNTSTGMKKSMKFRVRRWFPLGNCQLGVVKNGSPHMVPHAAKDTLSGHYIHATNRSYTWMGPAQIITDKVKLFVTYQVNGGKIEINDDMWHDIYGSFRIEKQPSKVVYFVNFGTEANELAMLMAQLYSGNLVIIALRNAYHGGSAVTIRLTALNTWKYPIAQGVGGAVELDPRYLKLVYDMVRKAGGVCISHEVQTGFGRTKSHYWGFQTQDVVPDIVTMAKGIRIGLPLGAVVTTPEIAQVMSQKIQFNTFGGNPVCSAGGLEVLKVLDKENRQKHCADVVIEDVKGRGLMVSVKLMTDRKERTLVKAKTAILFENLRVHSPAVEKFLNCNGHMTMLELCQASPVERCVHGLLQYALEFLHIVTLVTDGRKLIVSDTVSNDRSGIAVILDATRGTGYVEPKKNTFKLDNGNSTGVCRVLLGLARDDTLSHILTKLQIGKKLSELIRDSGRHRAANRIVTNPGKASTLAATDAATLTLRCIEKATIANATPITYHSKYLFLSLSSLEESQSKL
ncbi:alanine--glyoxylate aminotransferase 2 homolog 1, mitochondrial [Tanacetum coccineum]